MMAHFDPHRGGRLGHAGTFNSNVVSMAAGVAALTEVSRTTRSPRPMNGASGCATP